MLAIHATARPVQENEPIPREEMEELNELFAEAAPEETKVILGWIFDFHRMKVSLPENKFIAWTTELKKILKSNRTSAKELEQNIGRFVHLGMVIPTVHHFLSCLCELQARAENRRSVSLNDDHVSDLRLILFLLQAVKEGIDINNITYLKPTHVY